MCMEVGTSAASTEHTKLILMMQDGCKAMTVGTTPCSTASQERLTFLKDRTPLREWKLSNVGYSTIMATPHGLPLPMKMVPIL